VSRDGWKPILKVIRIKLRSEEGMKIYKRGAYTVELVFGEVK
jgi:hypothetical protein